MHNACLQVFLMNRKYKWYNLHVLIIFIGLILICLSMAVGLIGVIFSGNSNPEQSVYVFLSLRTMVVGSVLIVVGLIFELLMRLKNARQ